MLKLLENIALKGDNIPALVALRQCGANAFYKLPNNKTEAFKYTPVSNALNPDMLQVKEHSCPDEHCHCSHNTLPFKTYTFHFCDGVLHEHFHFIDGVEICSLLDAVSEHETGKYINKFELENFPFAALNTKYLEQGIFLRISKTPDKPIAFIYHQKTNGFKNIRNIIIVEKGVHAEFVEQHQGNEASYFSNIVNEIFVSKDSVFKHYKIQNESLNAVHIALSNIQIKSNGKYESYTLQKGGKLARNETHIALKEDGASAIVNAAYNISGKTLIDTTTDIEHSVPNTLSNQIVKGVVDCQAHGVFQGKIHIDPQAVQTEGYQIHKALLLSDDAAVDVKPELEIFADDVKCSHGATSGDLDKNELFYLQSRGISEIEARYILTKSFLAESFENIENESIKALFENF